MESSALLITWFLVKSHPDTQCFCCNKKQQDYFFCAIELKMHKKALITRSTETICCVCVSTFYKDKGKLVMYTDGSVMEVLNGMIDIILDRKEQWDMSQFVKEVLDVQNIYLTKCHKIFMRMVGKINNTTCRCCHSPNPEFRCSGCHFVRYCSETCSKADWKDHKVVCKKYDNVFLGIIFK